MRVEDTPEKKQLRKEFEAAIQYRHFLNRHKDGTYELEWVDGRWNGWGMRVEHQARLTEAERRERFETLWASRYSAGSNWKPSRSHAPGYTHEYEDPMAQTAWEIFNLALGVKS